MSKLKTKITKKTTVEGQLERQVLTDEVSQLLPIGVRDVQIFLYVDVPGGGDWSNEALDVSQYPVKFRATWTEES